MSEERTTARAELAVHLRLPASLPAQQLFFRIASRPVEVVEGPGAAALAEFYRLLQRMFEPGELETFERFQEEIASNQRPGSTARYLCLLLRDPDSAGRIACAAYASVQAGVLAGRFLVTEEPYRQTGISQEMIRLLLVEAGRWSAARGQALWAWFGECVEASEQFFNRVLDRRRLYAPAGEKHLREIHYELPHLGAWESDGRPLDPGPPRCEHLQLAVAGYGRQLPLAVLDTILTTVWQEWYVRSPGMFRDRQAWQRHRDTVLQETLRRRILGPLPPGDLVLLSRQEREQWRREGWRIDDLPM